MPLRSILVKLESNAHLKSLFRHQGTTIFNVAMVMVIFGSEEMFSRVAFTCPCDRPYNILYGCLFCGVPPMILIAVGECVSNRGVFISYFSDSR